MHVIVGATIRDLARGLLAAACLLTIACSGDGGGPAGPSPTSPPTSSSVSVTHPADHGTIYIRDQVQFEATVSSSGGGTGLRWPAGLCFVDTAGGRLHAGWCDGYRDRDEHVRCAAEL